jgi:photosystem II stability/assembly factor-like uncharacterized protein
MRRLFLVLRGALPRAFTILALCTALLFVFYDASLSYGSNVKKQSVRHEDLLSVTFADEQHGWACGRLGTILHTNDAARTWASQQSNTKSTLASLSFVDASNGWAVGELGTILHTSNGGTTWEKQKSPVTTYLFGIHFVNPLEGWIVTEYTTVLHTVDGGKTWVVQYKGEDFFLKSVSFADPLNGWAVGEYGFIYHTTDGGKTWTRQAGHYRIDEATGFINADTLLFDVMAVDRNTAWAIGIDGKVIRTEDGGKVWKKRETGAVKRHLFGIEGDKAGTLVIVGNGMVLTSTDNGSTWKDNAVFEPPIKYGWLYGVSQLPSGFVTVGWRGAIYRTTTTTPTAWKRVDY